MIIGDLAARLGRLTPLKVGEMNRAFSGKNTLERVHTLDQGPKSLKLGSIKWHCCRVQTGRDQRKLAGGFPAQHLGELVLFVLPRNIFFSVFKYVS